METSCPHEGLCLYLSLQESNVTKDEFCQRMNIAGATLNELTLLKRIDESTKERAAVALEQPLHTIFNNRVKRVWSFHICFTEPELSSFQTVN